VFALEGALVRAGASHSVVGIFEASAPILVLGLLYLTRFSAERNWVVTGLGLWLVVVAAVVGYAGPVAVWGIDALAVSLGFLAAAAAESWTRRA
jgi:general stress protein CsbA